MSDSPIADYALLSDCRSAALVSRGGSIDWLCFPRFDGPSVFGRLLDEQRRPLVDPPVGRRRGHPPLRRRHDAAGDDVHAPSRARWCWSTRWPSAATSEATSSGPERPSVLLRRRHRRQRRGGGRARLRASSRVRPHRPALQQVEGGRHRAGRRRRARPVLARSRSRSTTSSAGPASPSRAGESLAFALAPPHDVAGRAPQSGRRKRSSTRLDDTAVAWHTWSELHQSYDGPWRDLVHHSGRVLYALTYFPTGAICAAPTTSLPETPGGSRNWDYRYAWVRDASFTLQALWVAACPDEADKFFDFMAGAAASQVRRGRDLPDHVRHRRRARPHRTRAPASQRLAQQRTGSGRQRRMEPAAARRLRRAARRRHPASRTAGAARPGDPRVPRRPGRHRGRPLARNRTRASGRCAASPATSCTPS